MCKTGENITILVTIFVNSKHLQRNSTDNFEVGSYYCISHSAHVPTNCSFARCKRPSQDGSIVVITLDTGKQVTIPQS